jgi:hypothetical protein
MFAKCLWGQNTNDKSYKIYVIRNTVLNVLNYGSLYNYILLVLSIFIARVVSFMPQTCIFSQPIDLGNQSFPCTDNDLNLAIC